MLAGCYGVKSIAFFSFYNKEVLQVKRKFFRIAAMVLALTANFTPIIASASSAMNTDNADAIVMQDKETLKQHVGTQFSRLRSACDSMVSEDTSQANMFLHLAKLEEFGLYLWIAEQEYPAGSGQKLIDSDLLEYYKMSYNNSCLKFNTKYGEAKDNLYDQLNTENHKLYAELGATPKLQYKENTFAYIPQYLIQEYTLMKQNPSAAMYNNDSIYRCIYKLYSTPIKVNTEFQQMGLTNITELFNDGMENKSFEDLYNYLEQEFGELIQKGSKLEETGTQKNQNITVDTGQKPAENFSNVIYDDDEGYYTRPDVIELSAAYLALFSASSVYTPFQSYAGSEEFLTSIRTLVPDSATADDIISLYNDTKNKRKPLYKRNVDAKGNPVGSASIVTIADFLNIIEQEIPTAFVAIDGTLMLDASSATWVYRTEKSSSSGTEINSLEQLEDALQSNQQATPTVAQESEEQETTGNADTAGGVKTTTVNTEVNDTDGNFSVIIRDYNTLQAYEEITETTKMSQPVLFVNNTITRAKDNFSFAILKNIINNTASLDSIKHQDTRYIYVNAYGDIVLDDNLVILPGAANPTYYKEESAYPVYTAAFMNSYPSIVEQSHFSIMNKNHIGDYVVSNNKGSVKLLEITGMDSLTETNLDAPALTFDFSTESTWKNGLKTTMKIHKTKEASVCILNNENVINGKSLLFPYTVSTDTEYNTAQAITNNFYNYLMRNVDTDEEINQGKLNDTYMFDNIIMEGLDGTEMVEVYTNYTLTQYEKFEESSFERFNKSLLNIIKSLENNLGKARGVISLQNAYNVDYVGTVMNFLRENLIMIIIVIAIFVIICFVRNAVDIIKMTAMLAFVVGTIFVFVQLAPSFFTYGFNFVNNLTSENLAYEVVALKAERESFKDSTTKYVSKKGISDDSTSSLTLYRFDPNDLDTMSNEIGVELKNVSAGNVYLLNEQSGVFVQNDSIKMNIDTLFKQLVISGEFKIKDESTYYEFTSYKTHSNTLDYYTPYYQIVDDFIGKLNKMIEVFKMVPSKTSCPQQVYKDNFAVYSYTNSPMFLTPGEYSYSLDSKYYADNEKDEKLREEYYKYNDELVTEIKNAFGENKDWLGISSTFIEVSNGKHASDYQKTLWAKSMQKAGYYEDDWSINEEKMAELVYYINLQTKKFIIDIEPLIGEVSDDVLIKIISLRALTAFNQRVSEYKNMTYPLYINFDEISLKDILTAIFVNGYGIMLSEDSSTCDYVLQNHGWFNLIIFAIIIVGAFCFTNLTNVMLPVIYMSFMFLMIFKFANYKDIKPLAKGFVKMFGIMFLDYSIFVAAFCLIGKFKGNVIGLWMALAVTLLCLWLLGLLMMSLFTEFTNLGNTAVTVKVSNLIHKFSPNLGTARSLNVSTMNVGNTDTGSEQFVMDADSFDMYSDNVNIDDMYEAGYEEPLIFTEDDLR